MKPTSTTYYCRCSATCSRFHKLRTEKGIEFAVEAANSTTKSSREASGSLNGTVSSAGQGDVLPNRPIQSPVDGVPGQVVDYDGHRWYIAKDSETPGIIALKLGIDCVQLVYANRNIPRLGMASRLLPKTPLLLGRGESAFLTSKQVRELSRNLNKSKPKTTSKVNKNKKNKNKKNKSKSTYRKKPGCQCIFWKAG